MVRRGKKEQWEGLKWNSRERVMVVGWFSIQNLMSKMFEKFSFLMESRTRSRKYLENFMIFIKHHERKKILRVQSDFSFSSETFYDFKALLLIEYNHLNIFDSSWGLFIIDVESFKVCFCYLHVLPVKVLNHTENSEICSLHALIRPTPVIF